MCAYDAAHCDSTIHEDVRGCFVLWNQLEAPAQSSLNNEPCTFAEARAELVLMAIDTQVTCYLKQL